MNPKTKTMDEATLYERARQDVLKGALTPSYRLDANEVIDKLNGALATELVCHLRYLRHHYMATGLHAEPVADEFLVHAEQELGHAQELAKRITQLGGEPNFAPNGLQERSHAHFGDAQDLQSMIHENLIAERVAVESYRDLIEFVGNADPTTRRMLEDILAAEEQHADELAGFLDADGKIQS